MIENAVIHSKNGAFGDVEVLEENGPNDVKVRVVESGIICHAIINPFNGYIYADDKYGVIDHGKRG